MQFRQRDNLSRGEFLAGPHCRINVVGTSGSGKTTLARQLAQHLSIPHVELDSLHWLPNWQEASLELFRERLQAVLTEDGWVVDGNYSKVRDLFIPLSNTLIWLDYSFVLIMWRVIWRTLRRSFTHQELWSGNRESLRKTFFSRDSIIWWAFSTYKRRRREYLKLLASPEYAHLTILHFRSPRQTRNWMQSLPNREPKKYKHRLTLLF